MKYECDMIADLLPLYKDGVCSAASEKIVKEHIAECEKCSDTLKKMDDSLMDEEFKKAKDDVIDSQAKFFKRKSAVAGSIVASIFMIPILVCLIVNLATGAGLTWFFVVLAAMFIPASLVVVPLMAPKNKMLLTMGAFTVSLMLLLGVTCIYTGGTWFFIAASAAFFGLVVFFTPFIVATEPVKSIVKNNKGLIIMSAYTISYAIMMACIGFTIREAGFFSLSLAISIPIVCVTWLTFAVIRYVPVGGLMKTGICTAGLTLFAYYANDLIFYLINEFSNKNVLDPAYVQIKPAYNAIWLAAGITVGAIFFIIGLTLKLTGGKEK
ncbi:MAG: zf-HC2 domain-containing protein [Eubacterium sp.]|nr:zf-HC2 domain-containing protein [Eubacterium sp.]